MYNRGAGRRMVFLDDEDRDVFFDLLKRHLSARPSEHAYFGDRVSLLAANLLGNHFHLVLWQKQAGGIGALMALQLREYTRHFRKRHGLGGTLFAGRYRSKRVCDAKQFRWLIAYVHDNHPSGTDYRYSTHRYCLEAEESPTWIDAASALEPFGGVDGYLRYLEQRTARTCLNAELF